ncbi:1-phosphofructokinase family hexose kinase [Nocardia vaccinii]|uniref:1-phosphofructokinase family hexose kinase n=1 Tax=Nocardia vaccinii TaxID=1822 RepID=UPI000B067277|nr:1-phosphofructokinase family hexose kinase [Nocardia vaccinii]
MSILTLTMNPAIDICTRVDRVRPVDKMRCDPPRIDPGGGGINVARTVLALGATATAVFPAGGYPGRRLEQLVLAAGVSMRPVPIAEPTRESVSVTDKTSGEQFRFVLPGPTLSDAEQQAVLGAVDQAAESAQVVVASGSLPPGVPDDFYRTLAERMAIRGVPLVLDTSGAALRHVHSGVFLLKPSVRELGELFGRRLTGSDEQIAAARELISDRVAHIVVVSLGAGGALAVTSDTQEFFPAIPVPVCSGIGAGDAMVGGIAVGMVRGMSLGDAVRLGIAAATAALGAPGSSPGAPERIAELFEQLEDDHYVTDDAEQAPSALPG